MVANIDTANKKGHIVDKDAWSGYAGIRNKTWKYVMGHPGYPSARCHAWRNSTGDEEGDCNDVGKGIPDDMTGDHLYNLEEDQSESNDVAKQHPAIVAEMKKLLQPYFDSEAEQVNDFQPISAAAQRMAKIAGGWSPWEACSQEANCVCDAPAHLISSFKKHGTSLRRPMRGTR